MATRDRTDHPFQPGTRVVVRAHFGSALHQRTVVKAYKNGNFKLDGSDTQWRPTHYEHDGNSWTGHPVGDTYSRATARLASDPRVAQEIAQKRRELRIEELARAIGELSPETTTEEQIKLLETALLRVRTDLKPAAEE